MVFDALLGRGQTEFDELELVLNRLQFAAVVAAAVAAAGSVGTPLWIWATYSSAAEIAAASAADWFCRWIANHNPTSTPIPANPIRMGRSTATARATAPRRSRANRTQRRGRETVASLTVRSRAPNQPA